TSAMAQHPVDGSWAHGSAMSGTTMLEVARAVREHRNPARMQVEIEAWAPDRIAGLHTRGDCFVSMSHGEGWDLAGFDACAYGNPVVMTGWGGPLEYLDGQSAYLVDCDVVPVEHWEPESYAPEQHWAMPNHDHAVELLRAVARDIEVARARAAPLRERVLTDYTESRVLDTLATAVPELGLDRPIRAGDAVPRRRTPMIPRAAHFVFGLRDEPEELHLVHELAVVSCLEVVQPDEVHLHCHHEPFGPHWERIKSRVTLHHVERVAAVDALRYTDASVAHYSYA